MKNKISFLAFVVLLVATTASYIPSIFANPVLYERLHQVILMATVILFVLANDFKELIRNKFMNYTLIPLAIFGFLICVFMGMGLRVTTADILQIGVVYVSIWIGYKQRLNPNAIVVLLIIYGVLSAILGYQSITTYLSAFSLEENMYMIDAKNQIGAIIAVASIFILYIAQSSKNKKLYIVSYILFAILFILLIYIRCRTALLAQIVTSFIIIFKLNHRSKLTAYFLAGIFISFIFAGQIIDIMQDAFLGDRSTVNMDELSSNRIERNEQAIAYLGDHMFTGELKYHSSIEIIHNYLLNRLVRYGIWALPLIFIYFIFGLKLLRQVFLFKKFTFYDIGYFAILIPFMCSLLEPDAPFGPGTVYSFAFIMFGYSLKNSLNKDLQ